MKDSERFEMIKRDYIESLELEQEPLLSIQIADCEVSLYRQRKVNALCRLKLCQQRSSAALVKGEGSVMVWGSTKVENQRVIYGFAPMDAVFAVARSLELDRYPDIASGVFMVVMPDRKEISISFANESGSIIEEIVIPVRQRPTLFVRLMDWLYKLPYTLGLIKRPSEPRMLHRRWYE